MKALILGATGVVGRRVCAEVARATEFDSVTVAGRRGDILDRLVTTYGSDRFLARDVTAGDPDSVRTAMEGADVVLSAVGPAYQWESDLVTAAIATGTDYVSLADDLSATEETVALDEGAKKTGATIVSGCGMSPGLTNLLIAFASEEIRPDEVAIAIAASSADESGPATALHFLKMLDDPAPALSDGADEVVAGCSAPRLVYFPEPIGWVETFRTGHPEIATIPRTYPDLRTLSFRIGLTEKAAMDVVRASLATGLLGSESRRRTWLRLSEPLRPALESIPPRGAPWTGIRVDVRGTDGASMRTVSLAGVDRIANLAAIPLVVAARLVGAADPGVLSPEKAFAAGDFLATVSEMGIRLARLQPERV